MSHKPPIPDGNASPYPIQPAPMSADEKRVADAEIRRREAEAEAAVAAAGEESHRPSNRALGIGAAIGLGAAAAVSGLLYARRDAKPKKSAPKAKAARDKTARSKRSRNADRRRVAANQPYEVSYFARKHGITAAEARAIIKQAGPSRDAANALAKKRSQ